jgi:hypothetical protein
VDLNGDADLWEANYGNNCMSNVPTGRSGH